MYERMCCAKHITVVWYITQTNPVKGRFPYAYPKHVCACMCCSKHFAKHMSGTLVITNAKINCVKMNHVEENLGYIYSTTHPAYTRVYR